MNGCGQRSARRGDLESMDSEANYLQRWRRRATGDNAAMVSFGQTMRCSLPCEIDPIEGVSGSTCTRGGGRGGVRHGRQGHLESPE
jgi:hypothetical protein